jgi:uncharacterized protein
MQKKVKIFNDPVYGFISVPVGILLEIIEHPFFQRLRRISQLGLTSYVYPGALHTRFHHALGALHLMTRAVEALRTKGIEISEEEAEAVCIAILLHDIGHGPFSHALEHTIIDIHHEEMSILFMEQLNQQFNGTLQLAIMIFKGTHPKKFLHQLVSGQLDMDRLDYLSRDSFFTGVTEGSVGHDRLIQMLNVFEGELVVEEKGIFSVEHFLIARRLMYWQVYLHKTVLSAEQMLIKTLQRAKHLVQEGTRIESFGNLNYFLNQSFTDSDKKNIKNLPNHFAMLDDFDIIASLKQWSIHGDLVLSYLAKCLLHRKLFKTRLQNTVIPHSEIAAAEALVKQQFPQLTDAEIRYWVFTGKESNRTYNKKKDDIKILMKNGTVRSFSESADYELQTKIIYRYYICFPKSY